MLNNGGVVRQAGSQRVLRACHLDLDSSRESLRELPRHGMLAIWVESPYAGDRYLVDGDGDIFVMDADGSNVRQLTDAPRSDFSPAWSRVP